MIIVIGPSGLMRFRRLGRNGLCRRSVKYNNALRFTRIIIPEYDFIGIWAIVSVNVTGTVNDQAQRR